MHRLTTRLAILGALMMGASLASAQGTRQDTLDARCIWYRFDSLRTANGVGARRNLATAGQVCNAAWLARRTTILRVDTLWDTVYVPTPEPTPPPAPTPTPAPTPLDTSAVAKIAGPYLASAQQVGLGAPFVEYDAQFARFDPLHWPYKYPIESSDYYDRAVAYYVRWKQTGDATYKLRADSTARWFRRDYVERNGYLISSWEGFAEGMAIHFLLTGDTLSRQAVGRMGDYYNWFFNATAPDERVAAYTLRTFVIAWQIKAPSAGLGSPSGIPAAGDWATAARATLTKILARQRADGGWPGGPCGGLDHPFTAGLQMDAMVRYYEKFEQDPRIVASVKRTADYLWATRWIPTSNAFQYIGGECAGEGGPSPAPILNGLIVNGYAWLYKVTGDATYKTRATAMILGTVSSGEAGLDNPKMFTQQFGAAFRSVYWIAR